MTTIPSELIRIVAAILDREKLVLYKENGQTVEIKQGDVRIQKILDQVTESLSSQGFADVSLKMIDPEANVYREFENLLEGAIRFFRVHKDKLSTLFEELVEETTDNGVFGQDKHLIPISLGTVPILTPDEVSSDENVTHEIRDATPNVKPTIAEATAQIMDSAQPVSDPRYNTAETTANDTMIATVEDKASGEITIVPGMEHLEPQFTNAVKLGTPEGAANFVRRIAAVIKDRHHTIDELLRFMSRGDLPIADDGSIVAYKVLMTAGAKANHYVDCHSQKVNQRVGSYVTQNKVDDSRRTECSTGLHIARRAYLGQFLSNTNDIIVLVKIAPEDVIAVPIGNPNKMRVRGYHILFNIPVSDHVALRNNQPIESSDAKKILNMALRGDHIDIIEEVCIGGPNGTNITVVPRNKAALVKPKSPKPKTKTAQAEAIDVDKKAKLAPAIDVKITSDKVNKIKQTEQRALFNAGKYIELIALKKVKKTSWTKFGFSDLEINYINEAPTKTVVPEPVPAPVAATAFVVETRSQKAQRFFKARAWSDLLAEKKAAKVTWEKLGFTEAQIEQILKKAPKK